MDLAERDSQAGGRAVRTVGVLGAGTMGSGIAISLATAGLDVVLVDTKPEALAAGMDRVRSTLSAAVEKGRLDADAAAAAAARIRTSDGMEALEQADLVIEAVFESLAVKREVFASLGRSAAPESCSRRTPRPWTSTPLRPRPAERRT